MDMAERGADAWISERSQPTCAGETVTVGIEPAQRVREHELSELVERTQTAELGGAHFVNEQPYHPAQRARFTCGDAHEHRKRFDEQVGVRRVQNEMPANGAEHRLRTAAAELCDARVVACKEVTRESARRPHVACDQNESAYLWGVVRARPSARRRARARGG